MFDTLSDKQEEVVCSSETRVVVRACPGSGKTYSVSARLSRLLNSNKSNDKGIAVISFTSAAGDEIIQNLRKSGDIEKLNYPHFVGTIDGFINKNVFFPFGHLFMKCSGRPEIVGIEFNKWMDFDYSLRRRFEDRVTYRDPNEYFDMVSFNSKGEPIPLKPPMFYHFSWKSLKNNGGKYKKVIRDILESKFEHFSKGKANQADANYITYKLLMDYPLLLKNLSLRYSHLIIDEAQDTTEIQMKIIDLLDCAGIKNILIVGDPDQAIFEWNTANSDLFLEKLNSPSFHNIELLENRRSSDKICKVLKKVKGGEMISVADVKDDINEPKLLDYGDDDSLRKIINSFTTECRILNIKAENASVLYRSTKFGERIFQTSHEMKSEKGPWAASQFYVRDLIHGLLLMESGDFKNSLALFERVYYKLQNPDCKYVSRSSIREIVLEKGYRNYRSDLFKFVDCLPSIKGKYLDDWINEANIALGSYGYDKLVLKRTNAHIEISQLFVNQESTRKFFYSGTVHSVKGMTFQATLLLISKMTGSTNYATILSKKERDKKEMEEMKILYVACSRPKQLLWIATPSEDREAWSKYFGL